MSNSSKSQVDRLGEKLRSQVFGEAELRSLDEYRRTFGEAYDHVVTMIQQIIPVSVSGRPAKSTSSIIEKLNRESIRLSQVQDIAGCRAVVSDVAAQDAAVRAIAGEFERVVVLDRRAKPSHGYRAVHLVVHESDKVIEVQVRTSLQHLWAEMSEKCADMIDPAVKYGGGPAPVRDVLDNAARVVARIENLEPELIRTREALALLTEETRHTREELANMLQSMIKDINDAGMEAFS